MKRSKFEGDFSNGELMSAEINRGVRLKVNFQILN